MQRARDRLWTQRRQICANDISVDPQAPSDAQHTPAHHRRSLKRQRIPGGGFNCNLAGGRSSALQPVTGRTTILRMIVHETALKTQTYVIGRLALVFVGPDCIESWRQHSVRSGSMLRIGAEFVRGRMFNVVPGSYRRDVCLAMKSALLQNR